MFFVRQLPRAILSPNGGTRDEHRNGQQVVDAMYEISDAAFHTIQNTIEQPYPQFLLVVVTLTFYIRHGTRKCPRCRGRCLCYRPRTPSNFGGDISTPILDALVKHDIIGGKTWEHIDEVRLRIRECEDATQEGILVEVVEAE